MNTRCFYIRIEESLMRPGRCLVLVFIILFYGCPVSMYKPASAPGPQAQTAVSATDSDRDGILDTADQCPATPQGAVVDTLGCSKSLTQPAPSPASKPQTLLPQDRDKDGIIDTADQCPNTPQGAVVDTLGCFVSRLKQEPRPSSQPKSKASAPADSDGDRVADTKDRCPDTPPDAIVDNAGCLVAVDNDGDSVFDSRDQCPETPRGTVVNVTGCPMRVPELAPTHARKSTVTVITLMDRDRDGILDKSDKCSDTPQGNVVDATGCPVSAPEPEFILKRVPAPTTRMLESDAPPMPGDRIEFYITFDFNKADIKPEGEEKVRNLAEWMTLHPDAIAELEGHTDNIGPNYVNNALSLRRAEVVKNRLIKQYGVDPSRLTTKGYGSSRPITDNQTVAGRRQNRRGVTALTAPIQTIDSASGFLLE